MKRDTFVKLRGNTTMNKYFNCFIDGQRFNGHADKLIPVLEARGYEAQREEQNPHPYWQQAEHLKKLIEKVN